MPIDCLHDAYSHSDITWRDKNTRRQERDSSSLPWVLCRIPKRLHRAELLHLPFWLNRTQSLRLGPTSSALYAFSEEWERQNPMEVLFERPGWEDGVWVWNQVLHPPTWILYLPFLFFFTANFTLHLFIQRTVVESSLCARYCWVNFAKTEIWTHSLSVWELQWLPLACLVNVHVSSCPPRPQACVHVHSHSAQTRCPQWFLGCFNAFLTPTLVYRVSSTHHSHLHCQNPNSFFKEENATYYITLNPNFTATILTTLYFVSCIARCFTRYLCHAKSTGSACNYPHFLRYNLALL